ncbi:MAG: tRNA pseudouridine(38-40) synthase TruA [Cyanobacteria bacterium P01_H01_bin.15]
MARSSSTGKKRIALVVQYLGTDFSGWQWQPNNRTVQAELESAIRSVTGCSVRVHGAGRTDAGVHASAQVAHFDVMGPIPPNRWASILNARLPADICVLVSSDVKLSWHAQYSAMYRRYRYTIYTERQPNLFLRALTWHYYQPRLDVFAMEKALRTLLGKNDLSAFRKAGSRRKHSFVEVQSVSCARQNSLIEIEIQADGFLYGMVRLLVGSLVQIGIGKQSVAEFEDMWRSRNRTRVKYSAPAKGLCFLRAGYADIPFAEGIWSQALPSFRVG